MVKVECVGQAWWLIRLGHENCSEIEASLSAIVSLGQFEQQWGQSPQTNKNIGFGVYRIDSRDAEALTSESAPLSIVCTVFLLACTSREYSLKLGRCLDSALTNVQLFVYLFPSGQSCRKEAITTSIDLVRTWVRWRGWNIASSKPELAGYVSPLFPSHSLPTSALASTNPRISSDNIRDSQSRDSQLCSNPPPWCFHQRI